MKMVEEPLATMFQLRMIRDGERNTADKFKSSWYFSREEIENNSCSRKDGIDAKKESQLRMLYCSFLRDVGMRLGLPQITIATAMMFCHRFYLHQSHAKNEWQTIATVCMFLASKVEETPCGLDKVVIAAYEMMYRRDPAAAQRIHQKEVFDKQKALILIGERLLLSTIRFDFNIQHPYKPLLDAIKKLGITHKDVRQVAWNFVNDWLRTTLCLQYKPHYIAAGSLFLAAKLHHVRLPSERGHVWWHEFDVAPQQLEEIIQQMTQLLAYKRRPMVAPALKKPMQSPLAAKQEESSSPDSVLIMPGSCRSSSSHDFDGDAGGHRPVVPINRSVINCSSADGECSCVDGRTELQCQIRESESPVSVAKDGERSGMNLDQGRIEPHHVVDGPGKIDTELQCQPRESESPSIVAKHGERSGKDLDQAIIERHHVVNGLGKIDVDKIKARMKKRKTARGNNKWAAAVDDSSENAWIEKELEIGIDVERIKAMIKRRKKERESNNWAAAVDDSNVDASIEKVLEAGIELGADSAVNKQRLT